MRFEFFLCIAGAVILRPMIPDNDRYLLACAAYGVFLAIGKAFINADNDGE